MFAMFAMLASFAPLLCAVAAGLLCLWGMQRFAVLVAAVGASRSSRSSRSSGASRSRARSRSRAGDARADDGALEQHGVAQHDAPPRSRQGAPEQGATATATARVTVQVPLYNEPRVCERAVDAACALRWPRLEVQILDDSTDETSALVAAAVARQRAAGVDVVHIRRGNRDAFKAGALQHGLARAQGELIAIFDADFVPPADFLDRMVPRLVDSGADMAQARWGHLNREASWLTRAQAALLDAHFAVEQCGRAARQQFFGFNGTAGIWRKSAIERAGGWDGATLTEDLDLSLRAWFAGSRFIYVDDVVVPAELPTQMGALRIQQHRWAKGAMQTARLRLPDVLRARRPLAETVDVALKLTQNFSFVLLALLVFTLPLAALHAAVAAVSSGAAGAVPGASLSSIELVAAALGTLPAFASVAWALRRCGRSPLLALVDALLGLGLAAALSAHASFAALAGTLALGSNAFQRTPKSGGLKVPLVRSRLQPLVVLESAVGALHVASIAALVVAGLGWRTPFLALCALALLLVAARSVVEAARGAPRSSVTSVT